MKAKIEAANQEYWAKRLRDGKLSDEKKKAVEELVAYLKDADHWVSSREHFAAKAKEKADPEAEDLESSIQQGYKPIIPWGDKRKRVEFGELYAYFNDVIPGWGSYLAATIFASAVCIPAIAGAVICVLGAIAHQAVFLLGSITGIPFLIALMVATTLVAVELGKVTPKAIPALAAKRHLKRFFEKYPREVEQYRPFRSVLACIEVCD